MSAREWKPGDVAVVRVDGVERRALRQSPHGDPLWTVDRRVTGGYDHYDSQRRVEVLRPLVVIDPEDERAVASLVAALHWDTDPSDIPATWRAQAALRSLITPPKPEEPTNWLAVVEDSAGAQWYRVTNGAPNTGAWARRGQEYVGAVNVYRDVTAVKILSEGVQ